MQEEDHFVGVRVAFGPGDAALERLRKGAAGAFRALPVFVEAAPDDSQQLPPPGVIPLDGTVS